MDVERVQKINGLALELMKQDLVQDREEAIKQAEKILARKDCSSLNETMTEAKELNLEAKKEETLSQDNIKEVLEKNTVFIVKRMKEYQETIENLKKEISDLRMEVSGVKNKVNNLPKTPVLREVVKKEEQKQLEEKKSSVDHPRSGNYEDSDVSIEKFFYSGSKPKN